MPTSTHTPLISTPMETTNEPTKHVEKQRKSISILMCFSINGLKIFVAQCFWLWIEQPTSMYSESICSDSETHHNRVLTCKQQMRRQKGVFTCGQPWQEATLAAEGALLSLLTATGAAWRRPSLAAGGTSGSLLARRGRLRGPPQRRRTRRPVL